MAGLIQELKRRNVFRVGVAYLALSWLVIQVTSAAVPALNLPEVVNSIVFYIGIVGFPFALFFAWAFELTPDGLKRETEVTPGESITGSTGQRINHFTILTLLLILAFVVVDQYILEEKVIETAAVDTADIVAQTVAPESATDRSLSIAVLPFRNRSSITEDQYFVDGIHDDILTLLTRVSAFDKVISRTSVERYRDTTAAIAEISQALGVNTILEGGVQRAGSRVRINMQLIDSATDEHLWAETYDRELTIDNLFAIQSEIAKSVVKALEASLSPQETARIDKKQTNNLMAMEQYFLGLERDMRGAEGDTLAAKEHFQRAVELDPDFALAWTQLAYRYMSISFSNAGFRQPYTIKAHETVEHALSLDPDLGEAHLARAVLHLVVDDIEQAELAAARARELIPNSPNLFNVLGSISFFKGEIEKASHYQELARERGGVPLYIGGGDPLLFMGKFEEAMAVYRSIIDARPLSPRGYWGMAGAFWLQGALVEAVPWTRQALALNRYYIRNPSLHFAHAWLFWDLTDDDEAFCLARQHFELEPNDFAVNELMMLAWQIRGDRQKTLEFAHKSRELMVNNAMQVGPRPYTLSVLRDEAMADGDVTQIRADYEEMFPQLFVPGQLKLNVGLVGPLVDVIPVLQQTGEQELAYKLIQVGLQYVMQNEVAALIAAPDLLTYIGKHEEAVQALGQLAALGGFGWRQVFELNSNIDALRELPAFQEMAGSLREKAQQQLKELRVKEKYEDTCRANKPEYVALTPTLP